MISKITKQEEQYVNGGVLFSPSFQAHFHKFIAAGIILSIGTTIGGLILTIHGMILMHDISQNQENMDQNKR